MRYWIVFVLVGTAGVRWGHAEIASFGEEVNQFSIEFVPIANPGNPSRTIGFVELGGVDYPYEIGKYEVSQSMIKKANAASMHDGTGGGLEISVHELYRDSPDQAATGLTWDESARFVNWLNVSTGYAPAYRFNTQPWRCGI